MEASDGNQHISTPVTIHVTKDAQTDENLEPLTERLANLPETLEYSVVENVAGSLMSSDR